MMWRTVVVTYLVIVPDFNFSTGDLLIFEYLELGNEFSNSFPCRLKVTVFEMTSIRF